MVVRGDPLGSPRDGPHRVLRVLALHLPIPWPRGIRSGRDPAAADVPDSEFESLRGRVIAGFEAMASWEKGPDAPPHPGFGDLTTREWQRWAYRHAHHHLRQFSA